MELILQQQDMLPHEDSKAVDDRKDSVPFEQDVRELKTEVRQLSAQRKRRAQRVARRPQRLALGPASEHAAEIALAIQLVKAKHDTSLIESVSTELCVKEEDPSGSSINDTQAVEKSIGDNNGIDDTRVTVKKLASKISSSSFKPFR